MNIKRGDIITLNHNIKYMVLSKVSYNGKNYLYLVDVKGNNNVKVGLEAKDENNIKISFIEDLKLIQKLVLLFGKDVQEILKYNYVVL